jgi:predicted nucleic acid-binding protein
MNPLLIDTDVISFLFKRDTRAELYRPHLQNTLPLVSFMTIAELEQWALIRNWGERRKQRLETHLTRYTFVPFDRALCRAWAEVRHQAYGAGRVIETADAWIAATALLYKVPLVTHNRSHFDWLSGLNVISETA